MSIEFLLGAGNAFINPAVELTNLLAYIGCVCTRDERVGAETKRGNLVLQGAQVGTNIILQWMIVVAIGQRELKTAVLHRGSIHRHACVGKTSTGRNGNAIKKVFRDVLVPLCSELDAVVEHSDIDTSIGSLLLFPCDILIHEGRKGRTKHWDIAKAVGHVLAHHGSLELVLTDVLVTEHTVAATELQEVDDVLAYLEPRLAVDTPAK